MAGEARKPIRWSHSKLTLLITDPMSYHVKYECGIKPAQKKEALSLGSAVHWGLQNGTADLDGYYHPEDVAAGEVPAEYTDEQGLAEAMVQAYLDNKEWVFDEILTDKDGSRAELLEDEMHEITLSSPLSSYTHPKEPHNFIGIADLILRTDRGFILIDYKTSSRDPDWSKYLEQIYTYVWMLRTNFPDTPVYRIGIVNLRKSAKKRHVNESAKDYYARIKQEYLDDPKSKIVVHMYDPDTDLDERFVKSFIENLSREADAGEIIVNNKSYFINYDAQTAFGKSDYYDIYYGTPDAYTLYNIKDTILGDDGKVTTADEGGERPCNQLDIDSIEDETVLNKYEVFKSEVIRITDLLPEFSKEAVTKALRKRWRFDDDLIDEYWDIFDKELETVQDEPEGGMEHAEEDRHEPSESAAERDLDGLE